MVGIIMTVLFILLGILLLAMLDDSVCDFLRELSFHNYNLKRYWQKKGYIEKSEE